MTVVPKSGEHDHSIKQELNYQPKLHQFMCNQVKRLSKTLISIYPYDCMLAVVELVVLLLLQK